MGERLQGRVAIITGAGSSGPDWGTGKAMAVLFAEQGAHVVINDVNADNAAATAALLQEKGHKAVTVVGDATLPDTGEAAAAAALEAFGRIDILINNIGISVVDGSPVDITPDAWDHCFRGNVKSMYLMARAVLPAMIRQGSGSLVHLSSIQANRGMYYIGGAAYSASKAAVHALSRQIAMHHAPQNIRSNVIVVGTLMSNMVINELRAKGFDEAERERRIAERNAHVPLNNQQGEPWDIAYAALYLASDEAKFVTAAELTVDGGLSARAS